MGPLSAGHSSRRALNGSDAALHLHLSNFYLAEPLAANALRSMVTSLRLQA